MIRLLPGDPVIDHIVSCRLARPGDEDRARSSISIKRDTEHRWAAVARLANNDSKIAATDYMRQRGLLLDYEYQVLTPGGGVLRLRSRRETMIAIGYWFGSLLPRAFVPFQHQAARYTLMTARVTPQAHKIRPCPDSGDAAVELVHPVAVPAHEVQGRAA